MTRGQGFRRLAWIVTGFLAAWWLPVGNPRFEEGILEGLALVRWYAREHVLLCLVPAFFIAGGIATFVGQASVMRWLGPKAPKAVAYGVASVSGTILAVCSCTILPLFSGIYRMGAGLGPATAFLYSGPAINVLAIVLTARVLGLEMGAARAVGAIAFSLLIGLLMHFLFRHEEQEQKRAMAAVPAEPSARSLGKDTVVMAALVGVLVFANWARPEQDGGLFSLIHGVKWFLTGICGLGLGAALAAWFPVGRWGLVVGALGAVLAALVGPAMPEIAVLSGSVGLVLALGTGGSEARQWLTSTWEFAGQILPLLLAGVLVAGMLLGRPGHEGWIPSAWVAGAVGGNSLGANLFAAVAGAFMYFATLTEIPILDGLMAAGMGKGPALALLLAGPALSLPNMLVIRSVLGTRKAVTFVLLVVVMAAASGLLYGTLFPEQGA
ncbi:MAG: hypothetical protein D6702_10535 [Planctomycetota bacterium]|nr:MAG: hypothetical protein D6702_10535 [Planctomycetota bacterium]